MSKQVVLLFSGQGAQTVGMGQELAAVSPAAGKVFDEAGAVLGLPLKEVMFEGPMEKLTRTSWCQPALFVHGLACLAALRETGASFGIAAAAGLSLGEFTAHAAAGTFPFADGLRLVANRGRYMEEACAANAGSMIAMLGGDESAVLQLAADCGVDAANFNTPGQIVLSGAKEKIAEVVAQARERGLRGKELSVAGAYHSRLMQPAQDKLRVDLEALSLNEPAFPVISNLEARPVSGAENIRRTLEHQVTGSVQWAQSMAYLLSQGHEFFLELGPGGQLAAMLGRIRKGVTVFSVSDPASLEKACAALSS